MKNNKVHRIFDILGRKKIIVLLIVLICVLSILTISFIIQALEQNTTQQHIVYTESGFVHYNVFLKENEFFEKEYLEENRQYIASLIDFVIADFRYQVSSSDVNTPIGNYTYKIVAETNVEDKTNNNSIYKFSENLVEPKTMYNPSSNLYINEQIQIDYNKYNDIINKFINVYYLSDIDPTVTINMYVNIEGVSKTNAPVASLVIPLTTRTVAIDIETNSVNSTDLSVYKDIANKDKLYLAVLTFTLTAMIGIELYIFLNDTKDEEKIYKMKIKKILLNYNSYIQKIENEFNIEGYQIIEMKTFEDLLQVRDTISEPILMVERNRETDFLILSKGNVVYTYKLQIEDLNKNKKGKHNFTKEKLEN